jgi:hypothetical protein
VAIPEGPEEGGDTPPAIKAQWERAEAPGLTADWLPVVNDAEGPFLPGLPRGPWSDPLSG